MYDDASLWPLVIFGASIAIWLIVSYNLPSYRKYRRDAKEKFDLAVSANLCPRCGAPVEDRHPSDKLTWKAYKLEMYCNRCAHWLKPR